MTTELAVAKPQESTLAIWDRVDPMAFIERMGVVFARSGAGGCKTKEEGELMALACLSKRMDIFDINAEFHLMDGKLAVKADAMHARFRRMGGKTRWINTGEDGKSASLELIDRDGVKLVSTFAIEMAQRAGLVKDKGNWVKWPAQMLRSRCITDGIRMQWPEISGGHYSEDELADSRDSSSPATTVTTPAGASSAQRKTRTPAMPVKEPEQIVDAESTPVLKTEEKAPFDVESKSTSTPETKPEENFAKSPEDPREPDPTISDAAPVPEPADATFQTEILEAVHLIGVCKTTVDKVVAQVNKQKGTAYTSLESMPAEQVSSIVNAFRAALKKAEDAKLAALPH